jgi:arylsulfatase A-like enzyme
MSTSPTPPHRPTNVVLILADDLGFSDLGCYGGEIRTPNLDRLARSGVRLSAFYNTARCSPSRASLLTGRHPHETGIGILNDDQRPWGYPGSLHPGIDTAADYFRRAGYATALSGKWHLASDTSAPNESWPTRRGFTEFFGILGGADDYFHPRGLFHNEEHLAPPDDGFYLTTALGEHAAGFIRTQASGNQPFFLYLAFNAPHWPLHAPEDVVSRYLATYEAGWDELRTARYQRLLAEGVLAGESALSERDLSQPPWRDANDKTWQARRMAVYAAQVELMDTAVGRVLDTLEATGVADDTMVVFLSDNGACAENMPPEDAPKFRQRQPQTTLAGTPMQIGNEPGIMPGGEDTFASYGRAWANLSNTPFRLYKRWVHEGGIATPFIVTWPNGQLGEGVVRHAPHQLTDVLPTLLGAAGVDDAGACRGRSMLPLLRGEETAEGDEHALFWEHIGNAAARAGQWKIVREADQEWELYDISVDRSELHDLAAQHPDVVAGLSARWQRWADSVGVIPWPQIKAGARQPAVTASTHDKSQSHR